MARKYTIRGGFTFVEADGTVKEGGDTVELEDDIAEQHLHKLEADYTKSERKAISAKEADAAQAAADQAAAEKAALEQAISAGQ